ncbi:unnamed protein product, partial [Cyprideis torosa]
MELKQKMLEDEEKQNALFDKRLAQEETWIRQGIKARRTRNEGRVRALKSMRNERSDRRERGERARTPVKALSGGETNRVLLAKLFSQPANLLVLDEPTNDLDIETLELLEEILLDFDGTVLLVSHDREFMDNVVTGIFVVEGGGRVSEYVGGYTSWAEKGRRLVHQEQWADEVSGEKEPAVKPATAKPEASGKSNKLSYKDQRELDALP